MEGYISAKEFKEELMNDGLIIVPMEYMKELIRKSNTHPREKLLKKTALSYKEIADSGLWGNIGQKQVYLIALENAKPREIIPGKRSNSPQKITIEAVKRIARLRGQL